MKLSKIYTLVWLFIGAGLAFYDWRWTAVWAVSGVLNGIAEYQYKKETKSKKKVPGYIN